MSPRRGRSATLRIFLIQATITTVTAIAAFGYVYHETVRVTDDEAIELVGKELGDLTKDYHNGGLARLQESLHWAVRPSGDQDFVYGLRDRSSRLIGGNIAAWPRAPKDILHTWRVVALNRKDREAPVLAGVRVTELPDGHQLLVGRDMRERQDMSDAIRRALLTAIALTVLLGAAGGYMVSRVVLRRLDEVALTANRIMAGDLSKRVPVRGSDDEFDRVAATLNRMLERIEMLVLNMRTVTDSVAHDLRSPLNRIRNRLERLFNRLPDGEEQDSLTFIQREVDGIQRVLTAMLDSARAEAGVSRDQFVDVDLSALLADIADLYAPAIEDAGMAMTLAVPQGIHARIHRELLAQAVANLIDNAVKYAAVGRRIAISLSQSAAGIEISVADFGPGIPPQDREMVLNRFVRLDPSRTTPGSGLGLNLVASVARLHDGTLTLEDNHPGLMVRLSLPAGLPAA